MNAGNNMAFLRQARTMSRQPSYNPFAQAMPARQAPQNFGASMYATPSQRSLVPSGGQQDIGSMLQQFSGNQQQMAAQMQQFGSPMASSMQNPMIQQQMAAAQQFSPGNMQSRMAQMQRQGPQNMAVAQPMPLEQGRQAYAQQQQAMFNPSAADQQRRQMAAGQMAQNAQLEAAHRAASPQTIGLMSQAQQMGLDPYAVLMNPSGFQQQYGAQQQAMSQGATGGGMTMGGGPRGAGMTPSPQGMNAQNNMAFLQQARASRPAGFNPFAP